MSSASGAEQSLVIAKPNFKTICLRIVGIAPYVGNKFSVRAKQDMKAVMEAGSTAKTKRKRQPKDFMAGYKEAIHYSTDKPPWPGIPAPAFRNAMISACKTTGFFMSRAKLAIFVEEDGFDVDDGTPLVKFVKGEPHYAEHFVRNESGVCDLRPRPMWDKGWEVTLRIRFDADQFTVLDVLNLINRAGQQVGIGAGRPDSAKSNGLGWGLFQAHDTGQESNG